MGGVFGMMEIKTKLFSRGGIEAIYLSALSALEGRTFWALCCFRGGGLCNWTLFDWHTPFMFSSLGGGVCMYTYMYMRVGRKRVTLA